VTGFRVRVVDNRDSFVHTLAGYLTDLGAAVDAVEADEIVDVADAVVGADAVLISPGPGTPEEAGASIAVVRECAARRIPLLGVCLGHQAIGVAFGARVGHAPELLHGITSRIRHDGRGLFRDLPDGFAATRYHSLAIDPSSMPADLAVTARTDSGVVMAVAHRSAPIVGVQFHPESILTEGGHALLARWLEDAGLPGAVDVAAGLHPRGLRSPSRS
jgi:para-aminobenzoate synthetase component II